MEFPTTPPALGVSCEEVLGDEDTRAWCEPYMERAEELTQRLSAARTRLFECVIPEIETLRPHALELHERATSSFDMLADLYPALLGYTMPLSAAGSHHLTTEVGKSDAYSAEERVLYASGLEALALNIRARREDALEAMLDRIEQEADVAQSQLIELEQDCGYLAAMTALE